jgi:ABC-type glutathione transport system ATPase component
VADEPTGNLDRTTGESIIALFKRLAAEKGLAILTTTHNTAFAYEADRAITLEDGRIVKPAGIWLISEHTCWKAVVLALALRVRSQSSQRALASRYRCTHVPARNTGAMAHKKIIRTTVGLPLEIYQAMKEQARLQGCSVRDLVLRGVDAVLLKPAQVQPVRVQFPLLPPTRETIDLTNEQIYELIEFP